MPKDPRISIDGQHFVLFIESEEPGVSSGHSVRFPISRAMDMYRWLALRAETKVHSEHRARIGTLHSPTEGMIEAFLKAGGSIDDEESRRARKAAQEAEAAAQRAAELEAEFGIKLSELDI